MLLKTKGILFKSIPYSESSVVLHVLTEEYGVQSYLINGIRKKKSKYSPAILQSLSLLEMVVYHKETGGIQRVSEIRNSPAYSTVPFDLTKSSILMFLNEILYKSIQQGHTDKPLFEFIFTNLQWLDLTDPTPVAFHIYFLLRLSYYLGFFPARDELGEQPFFDLRNGHFTSLRPEHPSFVEQPLTGLLTRALLMGLDELKNSRFNKTERSALMDLVLHYYTYHVEGLGTIHSREILEDVFK